MTDPIVVTVVNDLFPFAKLSSWVPDRRELVRHVIETWRHFRANTGVFVGDPFADLCTAKVTDESIVVPGA